MWLQPSKSQICETQAVLQVHKSSWKNGQIGRPRCCIICLPLGKASIKWFPSPNYCYYFKDFFPSIWKSELEIDIYLPYASSLPKWPSWPRLDQAESRSQEFHSGLSHGWQRPNHLGHLLLFFSGHYQGDESEVEQLGLNLMPIRKDRRWWLYQLCHSSSPCLTIYVGYKVKLCGI